MAVPVAHAGVREALGKARAALSGVRDLRWVRDEQLHLTLRFFADLPADRAGIVSEAAGAACAATLRFDLELRGLGRFPPHGPLRVVWAGLGAGREELAALAAALTAELLARGLPAEEKPFAPHLTLGRARDPRGSKEAARAVAAFAPSVGSFGLLAVDAVALTRSDLGSGPPVHTPIGVFPLAPTRAGEGSRSD